MTLLIAALIIVMSDQWTDHWAGQGRILFLCKTIDMRSIIVPVNFSACADNAARYAADLALALHSELLLVHVLEVPVTTADMVMTQDLYEEMIDSADIALKALQARLVRRTIGRIQINTRIEVGRVASKVRQLCQEGKPYAVVVGASGPSLEKFIAGSPVTSLLGNIPYPVLVVPEKTSFRPFRHIVLACDPLDIGTGMPQSLSLLKNLRHYFGTRFDIITIDPKKPAEGEQAILETEESERYLFQSDAWKEQIRDLYPQIHVIRGAGVEEGLLQYLKNHEADMVMVFPKKHRLLEFHVSQAKKLAMHSPIPVMSIHE